MIPYLKENRWDEGMVAGMTKVVGRLDGSMEKEEEESGGWFALLVYLSFTFGFPGILIFFAWLSYRKQKKCPACGQHKLEQISTKLLYKTQSTKVYEVTYLCVHCGHQVKRKRTTYHNSTSSGRGSGPIIFGGGSGGFGGGGSIGGSFGGGMGGGGGAGSHF